MNRNFQDVATAPFPGVTVATLSLGTGEYIAYAKLRLRNEGTTSGGAGCVYQGVGIGGLDAAEADNIGVGETATVSLMDSVFKQAGDDADVHVQCFGPTDGGIHVINTQFVAVLFEQVHLQP
jgi:hypothetical protein